MRLLTPICGSRELTMARPMNALVEDQLGAGHGVGRGERVRQVARREVDAKVRRDHEGRHADRRRVVGEPEEVRDRDEVGPRAWFVTVTTVPERIRNAVTDFMNVTR